LDEKPKVLFLHHDYCNLFLAVFNASLTLDFCVAIAGGDLEVP
jgi:hypothetical protein